MPVQIERYHVLDPFDPLENARAGALLLRSHKARWGKWRPALASYSWGVGNVSRRPDREQWPESVKRYVAAVCKRGGVCLRR